MFVQFVACRIIGTTLYIPTKSGGFNPRLLLTFSFIRHSFRDSGLFSIRSTNSKQTLNGLFYVITPNPLTGGFKDVSNVRALFSRRSRN